MIVAWPAFITLSTRIIFDNIYATLVKAIASLNLLMAEKSKEKELSEESPMEPLNITGFPGRVTGKTSWAEVVGLTAEEAERKIKEEMAGVQIQVVPQDAFVTMDYQSKRVRIFVDSSGKVTNPPRIG